MFYGSIRFFLLFISDCLFILIIIIIIFFFGSACGHVTFASNRPATQEAGAPRARPTYPCLTCPRREQELPSYEMEPRAYLLLGRRGQSAHFPFLLSQKSHHPGPVANQPPHITQNVSYPSTYLLVVWIVHELAPCNVPYGPIHTHTHTRARTKKKTLNNRRLNLQTSTDVT